MSLRCIQASKVLQKAASLGNPCRHDYTDRHNSTDPNSRRLHALSVLHDMTLAHAQLHLRLALPDGAIHPSTKRGVLTLFVLLCLSPLPLLQDMGFSLFD